MDCPYGRRRCGTDRQGDDIYCGEAEACYTPIENAPVCDNAFFFQCVKKCPEGEVRDPLRFCQCIPEQTAFEMICDSEPVRVSSKKECEAGFVFNQDSCACESLAQCRIFCPEGQKLNPLKPC